MTFAQQYVQPGNWPIPNPLGVSTDPDAPTNFPAWLAQTFVPVLQGRSIYFYASAAARDADLAPSSGQNYAAYTVAESTLWIFDGGWQAVWTKPAPWTAFTPVWRDGQGTALVIGNGTIAGRYQQVGKTVRIGVKLTRGSTTNVGATGTSGYSFDVPAGLHFTNFGMISGTGVVRTGGGLNPIAIAAEAITYTAIALNRCDTGGRIDTNNPGSWQSSDIIQFMATGEVN